MTRVHDMGGRFGDGPVVPEPQGIPEFEEGWHSRALALTLASGALGQWNIDISRHARECLAPKDYARFSYYEKWLAGLADLLVVKGILSTDELAAGQSNGASSELVDRKLKAADVGAVLQKGAPASRESEISVLFEVGQSVKTCHPAANRLIDGGHTRLPAYASGAQGRILRCHGAHVLPDSSAHGLGDAAEPLYAVAFPASELWAEAEHPRDEVVVDMWQSYLEPLS
ncbi:MAG: nitrile hydratase subunit beta [Paracoccaceae bacterium]